MKNNYWNKFKNSAVRLNKLTCFLEVYFQDGGRFHSNYFLFPNFFSHISVLITKGCFWFRAAESVQDFTDSDLEMFTDSQLLKFFLWLRLPTPKFFQLPTPQKKFPTTTPDSSIFFLLTPQNMPGLPTPKTCLSYNGFVIHSPFLSVEALQIWIKPWEVISGAREFGWYLILE